MYENMINQNLYIREIVDPDSKKHYLIYIYLSSEKYGPFKDFHCVEYYITDTYPHHDVLVRYKRIEFLPEEYDEEEEIYILTDWLFSTLSEGVKRFEAIMSNGIKGMN